MGLWFSSPVPRILQRQAEALAAQTQSAAEFFKAPSEAKAIVARDSRRRFQGNPRSSLKDDWKAISISLTGVSSELGWAVEEALNFGIPERAYLGAMAIALKYAAAAQAQALKVFGRPQRCQESLVLVRRKCLEVEGLYRKARSQSLEDPNVVSGLKIQGVTRRFSSAAEEFQRAADRLAGRLAMHGS